MESSERTVNCIGDFYDSKDGDKSLKSLFEDNIRKHLI